jgi:hypothetical protein
MPLAHAERWAYDFIMRVPYRLQAFCCAFLLLTPTLALGAAFFQQGINGYAGTRDTYVRNDAPTTNLSTSTTIRVDGENPLSHGLLRFDDIVGTGPGQISPCGSLILSATLTVWTTNAGDTVHLHRMLINWSHTNTWDSLSNGLSADDIEMVSVPDASVTPAVTGRLEVIDVTQTVRAWIHDGLPNYGWGMICSGPDGWNFDSSQSTTVSNRPLLTVNFEHGHCPPRILSGPTNQHVLECQTVVFAVEVDAPDPHFQWFKDDVAISGATNATYTINRASRQDEGTYKVTVVNHNGSATSNPAVLTVSTDVNPPTFCAYATNASVVLLMFSTSVTNADQFFNFEITSASGDSPLEIESARYEPPGNVGRNVVLTLSKNTPLAPDTQYNVRAVDIYDECPGNPIDPTAIIPILRWSAPLPFVHPWRYHDRGTNLGIAWRAHTYDDTNWPTGLPVFDAYPVPRSTVRGQPVRTHTLLTNASGNQVFTHYFRMRFQCPVDPARAALSLRPFVDDGAVFYLNGYEILRLGMWAGSFDYWTWASRTVSSANFEGPFFVIPNYLYRGDNVLAVEVHQAYLNTLDLTFATEADLLLADPPPRLRIALSPDGTQATLAWTGSGLLEASTNLALATGWQAIQNATSPYGPIPIDGTRFFRVRVP